MLATVCFDLDMAVLKGVRIEVMAFRAEILDRLRNKGQFFRKMGPVADPAFLEVRRGMQINLRSRGRLGSVLITPLHITHHPRLQVLMAGQAEIRIIRQEQLTQAGLMGIMAFGAFPFHHRLVSARDLLYLLARVGPMA